MCAGKSISIPKMNKRSTTYSNDAMLYVWKLVIELIDLIFFFLCEHKRKTIIKFNGIGSKQKIIWWSIALFHPFVAAVCLINNVICCYIFVKIKLCLLRRQRYAHLNMGHRWHDILSRNLKASSALCSKIFVEIVDLWSGIFKFCHQKNWVR